MQARPTPPSEPARTPAQLYCLASGALLLVVGVLGFLVSGSFSGTDPGVALDDGSPVAGDQLLWFEVNGWHNVVHLASGLALLAAAPRRVTAAAGAGIFGVTYVIVTVIGLLDGSDVLGVIPVNTADNILHAVIAILGLLAVSAPVAPQAGERSGMTGHGGPPSRAPIR